MSWRHKRVLVHWAVLDCQFGQQVPKGQSCPCSQCWWVGWLPSSPGSPGRAVAQEGPEGRAGSSSTGWPPWLRGPASHWGLCGLAWPAGLCSPGDPWGQPGLVILSKNGIRYEAFSEVSNYTPRFNEVERGVYWYHLVRLSVCGQNRVRSVSSTILIGSILYL